MNIKEKLQEIFRDVFDDEEIVLTEEMTSEDIEDWDSLSHITLIIEIEKSFDIEFSTEDVMGAKNVGEFIKVIESKLG